MLREFTDDSGEAAKEYERILYAFTKCAKKKNNNQ